MPPFILPDGTSQSDKESIYDQARHRRCALGFLAYHAGRRAGASAAACRPESHSSSSHHDPGHTSACLRPARDRRRGPGRTGLRRMRVPGRGITPGVCGVPIPSHLARAMRATTAACGKPLTAAHAARTTTEVSVPCGIRIVPTDSARAARRRERAVRPLLAQAAAGSWAPTVGVCCAARAAAMRPATAEVSAPTRGHRPAQARRKRAIRPRPRQVPKRGGTPATESAGGPGQHRSSRNRRNAPGRTGRWLATTASKGEHTRSLRGHSTARRCARDGTELHGPRVSRQLDEARGSLHRVLHRFGATRDAGRLSAGLRVGFPARKPGSHRPPQDSSSAPRLAELDGPRRRH